MNKRKSYVSKNSSNLKKQQRTRQIYQRLLSSILCLAIIAAIFSVNFFLVKAKASSENEAFKYKYYTSITIESGETLWDIAGEFISDDFTSVQDYIKEVKHINHITEDEIYAGEELIVPYYSAEYKY